ncbi:hypothetical protein D3C73_1142520 [compost metagenome]
MGSFVNSLRVLIKENIDQELTKKLLMQDYEGKIQNLENQMNELFKREAKAQEIKDAYISLKKAQEEKKQIEQISTNTLLSSIKDTIKILSTNSTITNGYITIQDPRKIETLESTILNGSFNINDNTRITSLNSSVTLNDKDKKRSATSIKLKTDISETDDHSKRDN